METILDVAVAAFFGANPFSTAGVFGIAILLLLYPVIGSWRPLQFALACRAFTLLSTHLVRLLISNQARPRRDNLLKQVQQERKRQETGRNSTTATQEEEWENIDGSVIASADNGKPGQVDARWEGVVGFLHPFCNAGGGGERVLWAAIKATQDIYPNAICVVYTGDHDSDKQTILQRVSRRFDIHLHHSNIQFLYLNTRDYVLASYWPHFTLLGQAIGSLLMAWDALSLTTPDIFIDTMGYAFSTAFCKFFFPEIPTGAYVHYPFIGTHMVDSLVSDAGQGINAGAGKGLRGLGKRVYWRTLVTLYILAGRYLDIVMTNSSWTKTHMNHLWGSFRRREHKPIIEVVFPPVAVEEIIAAIPLVGNNVMLRHPNLVYIAQFRPEKNHELILDAFSRMVAKRNPATDQAKLVLIGSVRDSEDETLVYKLRLLTRELKIEDRVDFRTKDVSWSEILQSLRTSSIGVNGMWCEHFGIGVVEYQAAGLISVVNNSGGPKQDIVTAFEGGLTGFHATTADEYATHFLQVLTLPEPEVDAMRHRARASSKRFTTATFAAGWTHSFQQLKHLAKVHP